MQMICFTEQQCYLIYKNPLDVLLLAFLSDLNVSPSWFQFMGGDFP